MTELYQNKYRVSPTRLNTWDYSWEGAYFLTICSKDTKYRFGYYKDSELTISRIGVIADVLWHEIPHHSENMELGPFVVMPNHIHGIIIISNQDNHTQYVSGSQEPLQRFQNQGKNTISSIIGGYKAAVTRHARRLGFDFSWQSGFYDHIIRDEKAFKNISDYIQNNPLKFKEDEYYSG